MIQNTIKFVVGLMLLVCIPSSLLAQENAMQAMGKANAKVAKASSRQNHWDGPVVGPRLMNKKRVVFIGGDMMNTVISDLYKSTKEAEIGRAHV